MGKGDTRAAKIYETIGVYLGCTMPHYARFYSFKHLLLLGRVTTGRGGDIIVGKAREAMAAEFPDDYAALSAVNPRLASLARRQQLLAPPVECPMQSRYKRERVLGKDVVPLRPARRTYLNAAHQYANGALSAPICKLHSRRD